ncbi:lipopolysaccharide biosynthesis protein [Paenactinomyces guangxiensis]|uniref:Polysaccharide biosynthesis C-terminal domain-containing protein n=1 Tax=Paenactinomyces guangxiensis TaxID=1490290 RepID=A0A7W1WU03_9BACL|nr:polysaccharide biosynthesis C-terminal domain-containing protein [Paenactinomyces guangxiensis]MBA4495989.1 polysaccharide biosynthesis C-terminal domain-containing protein [Paenactinomyces guangxiensis]MBH8593024.1 polysaccharide biosynthesis C-terminal domain-containing protein [Paenactinomyces guangxiensis]
MNHLKRLFSDSAAFAVAMMGNKLAALLLVPIYTRYLKGDGQLAEWGLTNTITLILTYLCILGTDAAMAFYFYDAKDKKERGIYFTNAVIFSAGMCVIFTILVLVGGAPLAELIYKGKEEYTLLLPVAFLATLGAIVIQHILGYARYSRRVWLFNIFSMAYVIGSNLLSVYFLVFKHAGVMGIFYGQLIGQVGVALILVWIFRKEFVLQFSRSHLSHLIKYGAPLLPTLISFWVMTSAGRQILYYLNSPHSADIYEAVTRIASFIVLITAPFQLAWRPFSMSIKEREDAPEVFSLVGRALLIVGTIAIMCLTFVMDPIYQLIIGRPDLSEGYLYVWTLSLGTLFNVLHTVFGVGLLIKKETKLISRGFLIAACVYLIGNLVLVPVFHIWGAVSMTLIAYLIVIIWVYIQNQKVYPVNFRFRSVTIYLAVYLSLLMGITWVQANQIENPWIYYALALVVMITTIFATRLFSVKYLYQIGNFLPKLGGKR